MDANSVRGTIKRHLSGRGLPWLETRLGAHFDDFWMPYQAVHGSGPASTQGALRLFEIVADGAHARSPHLTEVRARVECLDGLSSETILPHLTDRVFGVERSNGQSRCLMLANFSRFPERIARDRLGPQWASVLLVDEVTGEPIAESGTFDLNAYQVVWLSPPA